MNSPIHIPVWWIYEMEHVLMHGCLYGLPASACVHLQFPFENFPMRMRLIQWLFLLFFIRVNICHFLIRRHFWLFFVIAYERVEVRLSTC